MEQTSTAKAPTGTSSASASASGSASGAASSGNEFDIGDNDKDNCDGASDLGGALPIAKVRKFLGVEGLNGNAHMTQQIVATVFDQVDPSLNVVCSLSSDIGYDHQTLDRPGLLSHFRSWKTLGCD